ncbi:MAG: TolB family protein [Solirubrobacteraceae bacterium]
MSVAAILVVVAAAIAIGGSVGSAAPTSAIAYVRGGPSSTPSVWLAAGDGSAPRRLGQGDEPLLSPDGSWVVASTAAPSGPALLLYASSGTLTKRLFHVAGATATPLAWSPDSRYLAVALQSTDPASDRPSGLVVLDIPAATTRLLARGTVYGASFDPAGGGKLIYAVAPSASIGAEVNIYRGSVDGSAGTRLTRDGRSLYPVWGARAIAFDRERLRRNAAPAYQAWLMRGNGDAPALLTHLRVPALLDGLVPIGFSREGSRLLLEYEGQDTSQAWTVSIVTGHLHKLLVRGHSVEGTAISADGTQVLIDRGGYLTFPDNGEIDSVPFSGGATKRLIAHGSQPSWNQ